MLEEFVRWSLTQRYGGNLRALRCRCAEVEDGEIEKERARKPERERKKGWGALNSWVAWGIRARAGLGILMWFLLLSITHYKCALLNKKILRHIRTWSVAFQVLCLCAPGRQAGRVRVHLTNAQTPKKLTLQCSKLKIFSHAFLHPLKQTRRHGQDDALKSRTARSRGAAGTWHISRRISNDSLLPI